MIKSVKIAPQKARYIKLGGGGEWEELCLKEGTLRLGYYEVPHDLGLTKNKEAIRDMFVRDHGCDQGTALRHANQACDFYDKDTLWITFSAGHLWWCFAAPEIEYLGDDKTRFPQGSRLRRTVNGWCNTSISGKPLRISELNGALTKTSAYRQTICSIKDKNFDYLIRKINDEELPELQAANTARVQLLTSIPSLMKLLQWQDFELLVDLVFTQSGWRRISVVGDTLKTVDIEMILPSTGERAMIQVKSSTAQNELDEYISLFQQWNMERLFYVYHSSKTPLKKTDDSIILIGPERLAEMILEAGLVDWLLKKVG